jgi:hypothetical protein
MLQCEELTNAVMDDPFSRDFNARAQRRKEDFADAS